MVGTGRFELPTPRTPSECSTRLSHVPTTAEVGFSLPSGPGWEPSAQLDTAERRGTLLRATRESMVRLRTSLLAVAFPLALIVGSTGFAAAAQNAEPKAPASIAEKAKSMEHMPGLLPLDWDAKVGSCIWKCRSTAMRRTRARRT